MKKIFLLLLTVCLFGCTKVEEPDYKEIMQKTKHIILDVRTEEEYNEVHIAGAINIPVDEIDENINLDKNKLIFVYCRSGNRSSIASKKLEDLGYKTYDLGSIYDIELPKQ